MGVTMENNFAVQTDYEIQMNVIPAFQKLDFVQEDEGIITRKDGLCLTIYPDLLTFSDRKGNDRVEIWYACRADFQLDRADILITRLVEVAKTIVPKAFYDEDAYLQYFRKAPIVDRSLRLTFFVNPHYPDGCWANHTL